MSFPNEKTKFKKGVSGNPNGRPRKFTTSLKEDGYRQSEINDTIQVMLAMTPEELKSVVSSPEATVLEITIASAIRKSIQQGNLASIETLITRLYGRPKDVIDADIKTDSTIKVTLLLEPPQEL
jgi:hypothetical protein